jgi:glutamate racemase
VSQSINDGVLIFFEKFYGAVAGRGPLPYFLSRPTLDGRGKIMKVKKSRLSKLIHTSFFVFSGLFGFSPLALEVTKSSKTKHTQEPSRSSLRVQNQPIAIAIATFDSGFGGFFTAKSIEEESRRLAAQYHSQFTITHYGDTANAPYGEKTPEQIAQFAAQGIFKAFDQGAEKVFIACNTASTQYDRIAEILETKKVGLSKNAISIISSSVAELKRQIDERVKTQTTVRVGILATPATVKNAAFPKALAKVYGATLSEPMLNIFEQDRWYKLKGEKIQSVNYQASFQLPTGQRVEIFQVGPGNWVDMIEHAAPEALQNAAIVSDLALLTADWKKQLGKELAFDVVGEFCTHFPVFDSRIRAQALKSGIAKQNTQYILQGPLMAGIFKEMMQSRLDLSQRRQGLSDSEKKRLTESSRPRIFISGKNIDETRQLAKSIFSKDPVPSVTSQSFLTEPKENFQNAR